MCESLVNGLKGEGIGNGKFFVKPKKKSKKYKYVLRKKCVSIIERKFAMS